MFWVKKMSVLNNNNLAPLLLSTARTSLSLFTFLFCLLARAALIFPVFFAFQDKNCLIQGLCFSMYHQGNFFSGSSDPS